ncbi:sugar phosphate isomerase/epimerase [Sagittula sp. MA-2]|jgi:sugar phosphate isomerase/epimerase|uniref:sugar phosphate isomerase/epimerase family protein n=1 Tax=Sagittula sp. MA-2 TaxID=3048007 RepID=UPI0024C30181|nr:sugar phosphate isomerase/epimerase [Sagittula sp. MA-2]WHZ36079.1 sugar phosphate isomerase/epimerase [Sagittula sp. MA-2]
MKLGTLSDSLHQLPFEEMLDTAATLGLAGVEVNVGGWSGTPHADVPTLLSDVRARDAYLRAFAARGLEISALNVTGNALNPSSRDHADALADAIRLAGALGVGIVVTTSGLPAANAADTAPNWITSSNSAENTAALRYQWEDVLYPFWTGMAALARENGVSRIAITMHAGQCVHNVHTLQNLRDVIGPQIGANLDPSQLMLMGADPISSIDALGDALYRVHVTDIMINPPVLATTSYIDTGCLTDINARAWSYATPGYGHDEDWWARFAYRLCLNDYDGWLSLVHQDQVLSPKAALEKSTSVMRRALPGPLCATRS